MHVVKLQERLSYLKPEYHMPQINIVCKLQETDCSPDTTYYKPSKAHENNRQLMNESN